MSRLIYRFLIYLLACVWLAGCLPAATVGPSATVPASVPTLQDATMIPSQAPIGGAQQAMVDLAVAQLSKETGLDASQISVVNVKAVVWRDASLGCPKPGIDYIQVETPGFTIQLRAGEQVYTYHTNETGRIIRCEK